MQNLKPWSPSITECRSSPKSKIAKSIRNRRTIKSKRITKSHRWRNIKVSKTCTKKQFKTILNTCLSRWKQTLKICAWMRKTWEWWKTWRTFTRESWRGVCKNENYKFISFLGEKQVNPSPCDSTLHSSPASETRAPATAYSWAVCFPWEVFQKPVWNSRTNPKQC